jgi:hypothetical protein
MKKRNLIIIYRGQRYRDDFDEISKTVIRFAPEITVYHLPASLRADLPVSAWQYPTLTVALLGKFNFKPRRGPVLVSEAVGKLMQQRILREHGIPTPPAELFRFGMTIDPIKFGEFVLLKPMDGRFQSRGLGINVFRRARAEQLTPASFPPDHPIFRDREGYILQKFVHTGENPMTFRVATFLGEVLYSARYRSKTASPDLTSHDAVIEAGDFTQKHEKTITFEYEDDVLALARKVAVAFYHFPLLGIDFVRDVKSSKLYVLEVNPGGNTWHFSSAMWEDRRRQNPQLVSDMKSQFGAFDRAAEALVKKTRLIAS